MSEARAPWQHIRYEVHEGTAVITLNRPEQLNSFTDVMEQELFEAFDAADRDENVTAIVVTGAGRAFCAGMDLEADTDESPFVAWRVSPTAPPGTRFRVPNDETPIRRDGGGRVVLRMYESTKPIIAAINGHAVGVGITMTLAADIRIASRDARVAFPFVQRGFTPDACSSWFLPRVVGISQALDWMLSGRTFSAVEGLEAGLFASLHDADEVLDRAMELAAQFRSTTAPVSVAMTRQLLWRMLGADHPIEAHQRETWALNQRGVSADADEGVAAFFERRTPKFAQTVEVRAHDLLPDMETPDYRPPTGATPL